jgi:hypothetical protein
VELDSTSLTYPAFALDASKITVTPDPNALTFGNFSSGPIVKVSAPTTGGIESVSYTSSADHHGGLTFTFAAPSDVGVGQHATLVDIKVCTDTGCANQVASYSLSVTYAVSETVAQTGSNGFTMTEALATPGVFVAAGSASEGELFLGFSAGPRAGAVAAFDPVSSAITMYSAPGIGGNVVLSGDGATLYTWPSCATMPCMITITQLSLAELAPTGFSLSLQGSVESVAVAPGAPQTLAVSFNRGGTVQIFDGTVGRQNTLDSGGLPQYLQLQWLGSDALYVFSYEPANAPPFYSSCTSLVDTAGVLAPEVCLQDYSGLPRPFNFANGLGYSASGTVANPTAWEIVATLALPTKGSITAVPLADATLNRLFVIERTATGTGCLLQSFTLTTLAPVASLDLPADASGCLESSLVRFGTDGLAFTAYGATVNTIVTITGASVSG